MKHTPVVVFVAVLLATACPSGFAADAGRMESVETGRGDIRYATMRARSAVPRTCATF